jgi:hypothetical protein
MTLQENGYGADRIETMSTAETKALIEEAIARFQKQVPALERLKLVMELELRGRGDIQLFRVEVPGPEGHARHRLRREGPPVDPALSLQRARPRGDASPLARRVRVRHGQGHGADGDPQVDPERRGAAGGAHADAEAPRSMSWRMPAEWAPHERTLMCWPVRLESWDEHLGQAEADYAGVANAIAAFEPVLMVAPPHRVEAARAACTEAVEVLEMPIDDSWSRDSGPIFVIDDGRRVGVDFGFNAWGEKFHPFDEDVEYAPPRARAPGEERRDARDLILEGGSIAVDGEGTLITTEQCLLHPSRNPSLGATRSRRG